jgi:hypothetical protein
MSFCIVDVSYSRQFFLTYFGHALVSCRLAAMDKLLLEVEKRKASKQGARYKFPRIPGVNTMMHSSISNSQEK